MAGVSNREAMVRGYDTAVGILLGLTFTNFATLLIVAEIMDTRVKDLLLSSGYYLRQAATT